MTTEDGRAHYFDLDGEAVFAVLHEPSKGCRSKAVLLIPPFGWEESCSYRARRTWATTLADDGFAVLRFDLPGTGDSAQAPQDPGRVDAWIRAIAAAALELRSLTGCTQVAAIGLGLGGLLACVAAAEGAELDELVLWAVPARGRAVVRELKAIAQLGAIAQVSPLPVRGDALTINGFHMSAETSRTLNAIDVQACSMIRVRRALVLERDGIHIDENLHDTLVAGGAEVSAAAGQGYAVLMAEPQLSEPPRNVIATVSTWLTAGLSDDPPALEVQPNARELCTDAIVTRAGVTVRERLMTFDLPGGSAFGVLTEPQGETEPLCAVFLNAGGIRRIGPNRMWVEASRRWAASGVPTLRLDLTRIGDAGGPSDFPMPDAPLYESQYGVQIGKVLDALAEAGLPSRILLVGLCSGAYWSFQIGQRDERVAAIVMLNPMALVYDPFQWTIRRSQFVGRILTPGTLRRVLGGEIPKGDILLVVRAIARRAITAPARFLRRIQADRRARRAGGDQLDQELDRLRDKGTQTVLGFSAGEPLLQELERDGRIDRLGRWPNVHLHLLDGPTAAHMLQPIELQEQAHALMDSALVSALSKTQFP